MRLIPTPNTAAALATSFVTIAVAASLVIVGTAPRTADVEIDRIRAAPITPTPRPVPTHWGEDCPPMDNPGGRLAWTPSKEPGPTPTNGAVALPRLGVEAPIVRVGIDRSYKMVVPHNSREVAWLDRGGIPGYTQNVVLAGHVKYSGVPGSFFRLGSLRPGDEVLLRVDDRQLKYRVLWTCFFDFDTKRADQIMGYTTKPSATLISCGGVFDAAAGTHNKRIVVRAEQLTDA